MTAQENESASRVESRSRQRTTESETESRAVFDVGPFATEGNLLDRQSGERAGAAILERMRQLPMQGLLIADCSGLRHASYPGLAGMLLGFLPPRGPDLRERYLVLRIHSSQGEF